MDLAIFSEAKTKFTAVWSVDGSLDVVNVDVVEVECLDAALAQGCQHGQVFPIDAPIILLLQLSEADLDHGFVQRWDRILYLILEPSQEVRFEDLVQLVDLIR